MQATRQLLVCFHLVVCLQLVAPACSSSRSTRRAGGGSVSKPISAAGARAGRDARGGARGSACSQQQQRRTVGRAGSGGARVRASAGLTLRPGAAPAAPNTCWCPRHSPHLHPAPWQLRSLLHTPPGSPARTQGAAAQGRVDTSSACSSCGVAHGCLAPRGQGWAPAWAKAGRGRRPV